MKLQRNNKYVKRLTIGLNAVILSVSMIVGGGNNPIEPIEQIETLTAVESPVPTPKTLNITDQDYYKKTINEMSDEEYNNRIRDLSIKYPDALNVMNQVNTIVVKDKDDNFKIIQTLDRYDMPKKTIHFYDVFTEAFLFDLPYNGDFHATDNLYKNIDLSKAYNKISYFDDKEIFEYGMCAYSTYFSYYYLDFFANQTGVKYNSLDNESLTYMYPLNFQNAYLKYTTMEIADNYIKTVPRNLQVNAKELGVKITYPEKRKYADFWKISDDEKEERYESLENIDDRERITLDKVYFLTVKDENNDLKMIQVIYFIKDNNMEFYNLFTGEYLFTISGTDFGKYDYFNKCFTTNFSNISMITPYFEDKTFVKIDGCFGAVNYVNEVIDNNPGYDYPDAGFDNYIFPYDDFNTSEVECSLQEIGYNYVTTIPKNMQVTAEELRIGMTLDKNKTLVK